MSQQVKPELVLRGRGVSLRLDEAGLRVLQGARTWTVPPGAVRSAEAGPGREVRIRFADLDLRGLEPEIVVTYSGAAEGAELFVDRLRHAMRDRPATAEITVETRSRGLRIPSRKAGLAGALLGLTALFAAIGTATGAPAAAAIALGAMFALMSLAGVWLIRLAWTEMLRDVLRLRRHGVTVMGQQAGVMRAYGGNVRYHRVLGYRTAEGTAFQSVRSRDTVGFTAHPQHPVEVTYDPADPGTAAGPLTFGHILTSALIVCVGAAIFLNGFVGAFFIHMW